MTVSPMGEHGLLCALSQGEERVVVRRQKKGRRHRGQYLGRGQVKEDAYELGG